MTPWPGSEVAFSQVREDPRIEGQVLDRQAARPRDREGKHVLVICSGGETALALRQREDVAIVDVVDPNPAQLQLLQLKSFAAWMLGRDAKDVQRLLGVREASPEQRLALYEKLRERLSEARVILAYWDARRDQIAYGLQRIGRFEELFRELARAFRDAGLDPLARPAEALAWPLWRATFERVFEREKLAVTFGRAAVAYSMDRTFGEHFADVFARALRRAAAGQRPAATGDTADPPWPGENPFLRQVFEDRYATERADAGERGVLPDWLDDPRPLARGRADLRQSEGRFLDEFPHLGNVASLGGGFDLVQTSNISDWMPIPELEAMIQLVARHLAPGGALLMRRLNGDHDLEAIVARHLDVDTEECARLRRDDRSFFYREVVVGRRPFEWGCP